MLWVFILPPRKGLFVNNFMPFTQELWTFFACHEKQFRGGVPGTDPQGSKWYVHYTLRELLEVRSQPSVRENGMDALPKRAHWTRLVYVQTYFNQQLKIFACVTAVFAVRKWLPELR